MLDSINKDTLRRVRLVHGWVTICGRVNYFGMQPVTEVTSSRPSLHRRWHWVSAKAWK